MTTQTFVPPLAQRLIERFELAETPITPPAAGERPTHTERALRLWTGPAIDVDEGYDFAIIMTTEFGWRARSNLGDWPMVMEWLRVHDPKDDPDESGQLFYFIRLTYIEGSLYVALYHSLEDAKADAWPNPNEED